MAKTKPPVVEVGVPQGGGAYQAVLKGEEQEKEKGGDVNAEGMVRHPDI